jgi:hypothetical protein
MVMRATDLEGIVGDLVGMVLGKKGVILYDICMF